MIDLAVPATRIVGRKRLWATIPAFPELPPFKRHVAMLLVDDLNRTTIARRLGVSRATISTTTYEILVLLGLEGMAGLARLAIRRGYIQP